jgi:putative DNA primase/helicase
MVKFGRAPLGFDPHGPASFFITVQTERGERTVWGRGLEKALVESRTQPRPGQAIGVRENGLDPMTFITRERDDSGHVRTERRVHTPRPQWIVERREFFDERSLAARIFRDPRASPLEAVRNNPELEPGYRILDAASKIASANIGNRHGRDRFLSLVRETLALVYERGDSLSPRRVSRASPEPAREESRDKTR